MSKWNTIPGYTAYEAADTGEVRDRDGAPLRGWLVGGCRVVAVKADDGVRVTRTRAALVALSHLGATGRFRVKHMDGDSQNDAADNLHVAAVGARAPRSDAVRVPGERWAEIPESSGLYEVSNMGRVRRTSTGVLMTPALVGDKKRYLQVKLSLGCKRTVSVYVHRAVLLAFRGAPPPGCTADHRDRHTMNNVLSNLRWCKDNAAAHHQPGPLEGVSPAQIGAVLGWVAAGGTRYEIARRLRLAHSTVASICAFRSQVSRDIAAHLGLDAPYGTPARRG